MAKTVLEELVTKFVYDVDQAGLKKYLDGQKKINTAAKTQIALNRTLGRTMRNLFFGGGIVGATFGIGALVKNYREIDLLRRSIEGLTKSTQDWEYVQNEAFRTGTKIETVAKGYRNFYAAATMAGFGKEQTQSMFSSVLMSARAIGATQQQTEGALLALEQMLSKGKVSMEELRRQLGNALPGAFEIAAKSMGVTTQKFNEMVKAGISANELVPKFAKQLEKEYGMTFPEAIKTLDFALVNLSTSWKLFQDEIGRAGFGSELAKGITMMTDFLRSDDAKNVAMAIGRGLQMVVKSISLLAKNIKFILILWGVNSLKSAFASLVSLKWRILELATSSDILLKPFGRVLETLASFLFYGGKFNVFLRSLWVSLLPFAKTIFWFIVIEKILKGIYYIFEDIFTYINHPEWESFTKHLAQNSPEIQKAVEGIAKSFKSMQPFVKDLGDATAKFINSLANFMSNGGAKLLAASINVVLQSAIYLLDTLTKIMNLLGQGNEGKTKREKWKDIAEGAGAVIGGGLGAAGAIALKAPIPLIGAVGTAGAAIGRRLVHGAIELLPVSNDTTIRREQTQNLSYNNNIQIYGGNRSDSELLALIEGALNNMIDGAMLT